MTTLTARQEMVGQRLLELLAAEGQNLTFSDLFILRAAWQGKLRWEEIPDHLRQAFSRCAFNITAYASPATKDS